MLQFAIIRETKDEINVKPAPNKYLAIVGAQNDFDALTPHDQKACRIIAAIVNLDDNGNFAELADGTIDADYYEIMHQCGG